MNPLEPETVVLLLGASSAEEPFDEAVASVVTICDFPRLRTAAWLLFQYLMETVGVEESQPEAVSHKTV